MTVSFSKVKSELLIEDGSLVKNNKKKVVIIVAIIIFCLGVTIFSLFMTVFEKGY